MSDNVTNLKQSNTMYDLSHKKLLNLITIVSMRLTYMIMHNAEVERNLAKWYRGKEDVSIVMILFVYT